MSTTKISDFYVGTTHAFTVTLKINGTAQDVTGDTVTLRIKEDMDDTDSDAKVTVTGDVSGGSSGEVSFIITAAATKDLDPGYYHLDIEWVTAAGREYIPLTQTIELLDRVSDPPA